VGTFHRQEHATQSPLARCKQRPKSSSRFSPFRREIADSRANANHPDGNFQCRRWYDLFAATPETHSVRRIMARSDNIQSRPPIRVKNAIDQLKMRCMRVHRRCERSVKPPENSRAFTASQLASKQADPEARSPAALTRILRG
jgi:hypothetical protein